MKGVRFFLKYLIPLLFIIINNISKPDSVNANPNQDAESSVSTKSAQQIISQLKLLPSDNITVAIKNYDNDNKTLLFVEIIKITDILKDKLSVADTDEILATLTKAFGIYIRNLEMLNNESNFFNNFEFTANESELRKFRETIINKLGFILDNDQVQKRDFSNLVKPKTRSVQEGNLMKAKPQNEESETESETKSESHSDPSSDQVNNQEESELNSETSNEMADNETDNSEVTKNVFEHESDKNEKSAGDSKGQNPNYVSWD